MLFQISQAALTLNLGHGVLPRQRVGDVRHHPHTMAARPQRILQNKTDSTRSLTWNSHGPQTIGDVAGRRHNGPTWSRIQSSAGGPGPSTPVERVRFGCSRAPPCRLVLLSTCIRGNSTSTPTRTLEPVSLRAALIVRNSQ